MSGTANYTVTDEDDLNAAIAAINADSSSSQPQDYEYTINFAEGLTQPIVLDTPLTALNIRGSAPVTINGSGATLDGGNLYAGLDLASGNIEISDLTIEDAAATGGSGATGALGGGGGGAGLGGGLSVGASAEVNLYDVSFIDNSATGGNGGGTGVGNAAGGAGSLTGSSATAAGSAGSFGDGGGGTTTAAAAGVGGFGGGGGGGGSGATGGAGAGAGNALGGGGGFGGGADIFVASGGRIHILGGTLQGSSDTGGTGAAGASNGSSGGSVLLQGGGTLGLAGDGATPLIETEALVDSPDGPLSLDVGGGTVVLSNPNDTYTGGTLLQAGLLDVAAAGAIGPGNYDGIANIEFGNKSSAVLQIEQAALINGTFTPTVANFDSNGEIDIRGIGTATSATAGPNDTLVVSGGSETVTLNLNFYSVDEGQTFYTASDGAGGTDVVSQTLSPNDAADAAVDGSQARSEDDVTGSGSKIGIISDSFNSTGGARAEEVAGFLPSTVTVLGDTTGTDEGRAMAELVHETAPGAQIYFDDYGDTLDSFAAAVTALANAGCNIIVDDVFFDNEPFFQEGNSLDNAIESFVGSGGNYFTAAGNDGDAFYQAAFNPITVTLPDQSTPVTAMNFGNGNALQSFTIANGGFADEIDLQWDQPFASIGTGGPGGTGAENSLALYVFDRAGTVVAGGTQNVVGSDPVQTVYVGNLTPGNYYLAVVVNGGSAPDLFRYTFIQDSGVTINDPNAGTGTGNVFGHALLADVNTVGADDVTKTPSEGTSPPVAEPYSVYGPGELLFDDNGNALASPTIIDKVDYTGPDGSRTTVGSDFDPFYGTSAAAPVAAAVAALVLQADPSLTPAQVSADLAQSAIPMGSAGDDGTGLIQATTAVMLAEEEVTCYCRGTRILTVRGEIAVEELQVGDLVVTASGAHRPIRWLGHRTLNCRTHPRPEEAHPIRIARHAFGENKPAQELYVSPAHAICVDMQGEVLIPASALANGATITQIEVDQVTYWHVELDSHDILVANGLPAESYIEMGNRRFFLENDIIAFDVSPDADSRVTHTHADYCRPLVTGGPVLGAVKTLLQHRAQILGWTLADSPLADLHIMAGDTRIDPVVRGLTARFDVPACAGNLWLVSATSRPSDVGKGDDNRDLGVSLAELTIDDGFDERSAIALHNPLLSAGFHRLEEGWRWTAGRAHLPAALWDHYRDGFFLRVHLTSPALPRWVMTQPLAASPAGQIQVPVFKRA